MYRCISFEELGGVDLSPVRDLGFAFWEFFCLSFLMLFLQVSWWPFPRNFEGYVFCTWKSWHPYEFLNITISTRKQKTKSTLKLGNIAGFPRIKIFFCLSIYLSIEIYNKLYSLPSDFRNSHTSQIGSFPQLRGEHKNMWIHHPATPPTSEPLRWALWTLFCVVSEKSGEHPKKVIPPGK